MKNKKGFTLIEILATIVILSIVFVIAAISVVSNIESAKLKAKENSAKSYIKNINDHIAEDSINSKNIKDGTYNVSDFKKYNKTISGELPVAGYIVIKNQKVDDYNLLYTESDETFNINNKESKLYKQSNTNIINVQDYGAVGDGTTDDTQAIQNAIKELNKAGGILYFPYGTYLVSATKNKDSILCIDSKKDIQLQMLGSTIKIKPNHYPEYYIIQTKNSNNVVIRDGYIVGDRLEHTYDPYQVVAPPNELINTTHEFGYGIYNYYSKNVIISNMNISQMTGDAIINKTSTKNGNTNYALIENSELSYSRRQGLSVLDTDIIEVNNVYIHNIGDNDGIAGTSPEAGIDIEPASGEKIVNSITLNKVKIEKTDYFGIVGNKANEYIIKDSSIDSPSIQNAKIDNSIFTFLNPIGYSISNCEINDSKIKNYAKAQTIYVASSKINNTLFEGIDEEISSRIAIKSDAIITNSTFKNIRGRTGNITTFSTEHAGLMYNNEYGSNPLSKNNVYDNCVFIFNIYSNTENVFNEQNSTIKNSFISVYGRQSLTFNDITFLNNSTISYSSKGYTPTLYFNNCKIIDSGTFGNMNKVLNNTKVIIDGVEKDSF